PQTEDQELKQRLRIIVLLDASKTSLEYDIRPLTPPQVAYLLAVYNLELLWCAIKADEQLTTLIKNFPHVMWSGKVLTAILNICQLLSQSLEVDPNEAAPVYSVPNTPFHPADRLSERKTRVTHFVGHCSNILREATTWCPGLVRSHLVHYLLDNQSVAEAIRGQHCGLSYAAEQILALAGYHRYSKSKPNQETSELPRCISRDMSNCVAVLQLRASCSPARITPAPCSASAPMIVHPDTPDKCVRPLLHDLCWGGLRQFNSDVLDAAVSCWLCGERRARVSACSPSRRPTTPLVFCEDYQLSQPVPDVEPHRIWVGFLSEQLTAFKYIKHWRRVSQLPYAHQIAANLFRNNIAATGGAVAPAMDGPGLSYRASGPSPTGLRKAVLRDKVYTACVIKRHFTRRAEFRRSVLAAVLAEMLQPNQVEKKSLEGGLESQAMTALTLHAGGAGGVGVGSGSGGSAIGKRPRRLWSVRRHGDGASIRRSTGDGSGYRRFVGFNDEFSISSIIITAIRCPPRRPWLQRLELRRPFQALRRRRLAGWAPGSSASGHQRLGVVRDGSATLGAGSGVGGGGGISGAASTAGIGAPSSNTVTKEYLRRRQLILLLVTNELERLITWCNPIARQDQAFPADKEAKLNDFLSKQTLKQKELRAYAGLAWRVNPVLAVFLPLRFPNSNELLTEVCRLVCCNPDYVNSVPEALQFLATPSNVDNDVPELTHMLTWAPVSPVDALAFFSRMYAAHPLTHQYAVRTLASYPPEAMIFYIPQLVQAVRYDQMGYMTEFILNLAKRSQLCAHQLLWNMQTNAYKDDEGKVIDPAIGSTLLKLMDHIVGQLDGNSRSFYDREFDFFHEVTNISAIIKDYEKGERRREACRRALREVQLRTGCYLPTNPD
uniref:1-phosphatidylinositol 4-kinase n=1 Tax=Macrostomum lignano TaxID=282301 RepID=A0A1I8F4F2_9PLAT